MGFGKQRKENEMDSIMGNWANIIIIWFHNNIVLYVLKYKGHKGYMWVHSKEALQFSC